MATLTQDGVVAEPASTAAEPLVDVVRAALTCVRLRSHADWLRYQNTHASQLEQRRTHELRASTRSTTGYPGVCVACATRTRFRLDASRSYATNGQVMPNWREQLACPRCGLISRKRAVVHLLPLLGVEASASLLIAEQTTGFFRWLSAHYPRVTGFEYLGEKHPFGQTNPQGIRNETLTALTFGAESFEVALNFDVLEHIPDYPRALAECRRVLTKNGKLFFSVPFGLGRSANVVRARRAEDGRVEHLLPAEYHGDPLRQEGCLAFHDFGWSLLDDVRQAGFRDAAVYLYWSKAYGYLGANQVLLEAIA